VLQRALKLDFFYFKWHSSKRYILLKMRPLLFLATALSLVSAWDISNANDRHACQLHSKNPLEGCDQGRTVFVDTVGVNSKFQTVQSGNTFQQLLKHYG
jgi:hypothetical protein